MSVRERKFRIAVGGFHHETNSFAPNAADLDDFIEPSAWPGLTIGPAVFEAISGMNLALAGFVEEVGQSNIECCALCWASATPSGPVTDRAFEHVTAILLQALAHEMDQGIDAVFLDLHGAMITDSFDDAEGELLTRVRELIGPNMPLMVALDLHANVTRRMVDSCDGISIYRTYPHIDMDETGARVARAIVERLRSPAPVHRAWLQIPFLIPLTSGCTWFDPARAIYEKVSQTDDVLLSFACGFPLSDIFDVGPAVVAYGRDATAVAKAAEELKDDVLTREAAFASGLVPPAEAVTRAHLIAETTTAPVVLADAQDNPGGGADGDSTRLLREFLKQGGTDMVIGLLYDPAAAAVAHNAGIGARVTLALGGRSDPENDPPLQAEFTVQALSDGRFDSSGTFYAGARMDLGRMAVLEIEGCQIVVTSRKQQAADPAMFEHIGINLNKKRFVVVKSSVHFRADFDVLASETIVVAGGGPTILRPEELPFRKARKTVRRVPNDQPCPDEQRNEK